MKALLAMALVLALSCVAMAQIAELQIKVVAGEGAVHPPGVHIAHPLTVEVTNAAGQPVAGAAVTFQLPSEGAGGLFANGLRSDLILTDRSGRAIVSSLQFNRTSGPFVIRITAVKDQAHASLDSNQSIAASQNAEKSGEITPTTMQMGSGSHKKWLLLAVAVAAGAGAAFAGLSHGSKSDTSSSSGSNNTTSVGTPTITIGHP